MSMCFYLFINFLIFLFVKDFETAFDGSVKYYRN